MGVPSKTKPGNRPAGHVVTAANLGKRFLAIVAALDRLAVRSDFCMSRTESAARAAVLFSARRTNDPISLSNMNKVASVTSVSSETIVANRTAWRRPLVKSRICCAVMRRPSAASLSNTRAGTLSAKRRSRASSRMTCKRSIMRRMFRAAPTLCRFLPAHQKSKLLNNCRAPAFSRACAMQKMLAKLRRESPQRVEKKAC
jgi:hypothetical protein